MKEDEAQKCSKFQKYFSSGQVNWRCLTDNQVKKSVRHMFRAQEMFWSRDKFLIVISMQKVVKAMRKDNGLQGKRTDKEHKPEL